MKVHTYAPPSVQVAVPGDGNRLIVGSWPDGEQVVFMLTEEVAKFVGEKLTASGIQVASSMPRLPYGPDGNPML